MSMAPCIRSLNNCLLANLTLPVENTFFAVALTGDSPKKLVVTAAIVPVCILGGTRCGLEIETMARMMGRVGVPVS